jgi:carbon storage regulator
MEKPMLILSRNQNESIIIDGDIKVTVLSDKHGQVKLGIEAPDDVEIWREEIYEGIQKLEGFQEPDLGH